MLADPYLVCVVKAFKRDPDQADASWTPTKLMTGSQVASLQVCKYAEPKSTGSHSHTRSKPGVKEQGLFVFNDLQIGEEGEYCLQFTVRQLCSWTALVESTTICSPVFEGKVKQLRLFDDFSDELSGEAKLSTAKDPNAKVLDGRFRRKPEELWNQKHKTQNSPASVVPICIEVTVLTRIPVAKRTLQNCGASRPRSRTTLDSPKKCSGRPLMT
jgi:hypothetical protein